jgi:hypothetical protein
MVERLTGIIRAQKQAGMIPDPTLLDTSEASVPWVCTCAPCRLHSAVSCRFVCAIKCARAHTHTHTMTIPFDVHTLSNASLPQVELVDMKFLDDQPILVVQFTCQQINCTRDSFGNVVEGAPDEVKQGFWDGP